ncbi:MAG TPA: 1,6-anhydro-N-acetylmuramyl-L-alanine amidase AmpD [Burkholderiaceae bacterium]|nr:1,6-anhydro-N-acetylmuramyl-L-alanine amidase AmpD [Burkholderiaceae bacterium]
MATARTDARAAWRDGWWRRAAPIESPNHNARPEPGDVSLVVVHSISLPPGEYGGDAIERLFTNTLDWDTHPYFQSIRDLKVSAHFVIRRSGKLLQFVSCDRRAWHAGVSEWRGRDNCNDYSIGIELEGLEGERFESAQYTKLSALLRALARRYRIEAVVGHEHVAPARKRDPGKGFDWPRLARALRWSSARVPFASSTTVRDSTAKRPQSQ